MKVLEILGIFIGLVFLVSGPALSEGVNDQVTFVPDASTYTFTTDNTGCPEGFVGKFYFDSHLTNISNKELRNLFVDVDELTNDNLLLTNNELIGEGGRFEVPNSDDYSDGILRSNEYVYVPFCVCLQDKDPFRFFVNVLGDVKVPAPVPKTGQTISYEEGDDGDLQKGVVWPIPRFTDNLDGTITDNLTNLIWDKNASRYGPFAWTTAVTHCNQLEDGAAGLTDGSVAGDWSLANRFELESLLHMGENNLATPDTTGTGKWKEGDPFTNVGEGADGNAYWTSSTTGEESAWMVDFTDREVRDAAFYDWDPGKCPVCPPQTSPKYSNLMCGVYAPM